MEIQLLNGKDHDLGGGMIVSRILPQVAKRMVGPFVFFDHMGPFVAAADQNTDVRPHPHIGLSTLTYLFEGRIVHHDSLGKQATIVPGEVNWMTAGRGISHSERTHAEDRGKPRRLHGLQLWIALPDGDEEVAPDFQHYGAKEIPELSNGPLTIKVIAGEGFGLKSRVRTSSPLILAQAISSSATQVIVDFANFEMALYVVKGVAQVGDSKANPKQMMLLPPTVVTVNLSSDAEVIFLGGLAFSTPRFIWWNMVSSSKARIEAAKRLWIEGQFPMVPGETEWIPAPNTPV